MNLSNCIRVCKKKTKKLDNLNYEGKRNFIDYAVFFLICGFPGGSCLTHFTRAAAYCSYQFWGSLLLSFVFLREISRTHYYDMRWSVSTLEWSSSTSSASFLHFRLNFGVLVSFEHARETKGRP